jgi:crotonobetainyl-CoA:carnitine CoA-transferase CaiB-like acyl-CoA transferase
MSLSPANRRYACADSAIRVECETPEQWHSLAVSLGRPELAYPGGWETVQEAPPDGPLGQLLENIFAEEKAETWIKRLEGHGVPVRPS